MKAWIIPFVLMMATCNHAQAYREGAEPVFGTYSKAYQDRQQAKQWKRLCNGAGRYQAMSEAYALGKPDPCFTAPKPAAAVHR